MGLLDWLFGRKPSGDAGHPINPRRSKTNQEACPQCGTTLRQTRTDGRCVACGMQLSKGLEGAPSASTPRAASQASPRTKPPRPSNVQQLGNSPMVSFDHGGMTMIMDLDAFDYTYGDATGPDPTQTDLDALLPQVTRVCVLEGPMFRGSAMSSKVLLDLHDAEVIRALTGCLRIVEDPQTFGHCHCLGGPTMELYAGCQLAATIGLQHGQAIRWKQWHHDARLQDGDRLTRWLQEHGIDPVELQRIYQRGGNIFETEVEASTERQKQARQLASEAQERAQAGAIDEALQLCNQALALDPEPMEPQALRGEIYYHLGRLSEAATDCSAVIDRGFRHAQTYFVRAIALDSMQRTEEALADCSMALHLDPEHAGAYNSRGLMRGRLGQLEQAAADFSEALRLAPKWFLPYFHRAQTYHAQHPNQALADYDQAISLLKEATPSEAGSDRNPALTLVYCRRGDAYYDLFREDEAEADFAEARSHDPASAAGYLGDIWLRRNKFELAKQEYSQLIELMPQDGRGFIGRGTAHEALGDLEEASADYSEAIRLQPTVGLGYGLRARVRHRQGRTDDALADLSQQLRHQPEDAMAYLFRSALHKESGALKAALDDLNAAYKAAPDHPLVRNNLAWMLATCSDGQLRDGSRAVTLARQACQATDWQNPFCMGTLGAAFAETGVFEEASRWQKEALTLYPEQEKAAGLARLELYQAGLPYRE
jgi:tetratricopeptide (TPR) repeat protein